jgi:FkbM family methyltransferase
MSKTLVAARRIVGREPEVIVDRDGATWHLDLREGIDLAIYLGVYEARLRRAVRRHIAAGSTAIDVGANVGVYTMMFAGLVGPHGRVMAIEPTAFAIEKLRRNLSLNPLLASRVDLHQVFLSGSSTAILPPSVYSSWPVSETSGETHPTLMGRKMGTEGAYATSLDDLLASRRSEGEVLTNIAFIKVDVDGYELDVLEGAVKTIMTHRPVLLAEFAPHLHGDPSTWAASWVSMMSRIEYEFRHPADMSLVPMNGKTLEAIVPQGASVDLLGVPRPGDVDDAQH